jgi:hypothetical protein
MNISSSKTGMAYIKIIRMLLEPRVLTIYLDLYAIVLPDVGISRLIVSLAKFGVWVYHKLCTVDLSML